MDKLAEKPNKMLSAIRVHAEWESRTKVKKTLVNINSSLEEIQKDHPLITSKGGVPLFYDENNVYVDADDSHTLILGSTGSKKTRLVVLPTVHILAAAGESMIITDPKAEIYGRTADMLEKLGYSVGVFNFRQPSHGDGWNPLEIPYKFYINQEPDRANEFVNDIAQNIMLADKSARDMYWDYSASDLFVGLILYTFRLFAREKRQEIPSLKDVLDMRARCFNDDGIDEEFMEAVQDDKLAYHALLGTITARERTRSSILSVFDQKVRVFLFQNDLVQMMRRNTHSLDKIGDRKSAIFLIMPDEKTTYHRLISLFVKQSYEYLIFLAQSRKSASFPVRINYLLDEFSTLPTIADFPAMITAARSRNIRFNLVVQSQKQLVSRYGDEAETIKANCNNWIFLTSRELSLLREISILTGTLKDGTPLISVFALQHLDKEQGEALVLSNRLCPFISRLEDISVYDHDQYEFRQPKRRIDDAISIAEASLLRSSRANMAKTGKSGNETNIDKVAEEDECEAQNIDSIFDELFRMYEEETSHKDDASGGHLNPDSMVKSDTASDNLGSGAPEHNDLESDNLGSDVPGDDEQGSDHIKSDAMEDDDLDSNNIESEVPKVNGLDSDNIENDEPESDSLESSVPEVGDLKSDSKESDDLGNNDLEDDDFDDNLSNIVTLNDEDGNEIRFEFLDLIEYNDKEYVVLLPVDEDGENDDGEVVILQLEDDGEDTESYVSVDDEDVLQAVFDIFRDKFKNEFNFLNET